MHFHSIRCIMKRVVRCIQFAFVSDAIIWPVNTDKMRFEQCLSDFGWIMFIFTFPVSTTLKDTNKHKMVLFYWFL